MQGYTPVFGSVYAGTLCGKWPTAAVWVSLLPMCDKRGHIDMSHAAISALTGWPLELLKQGIAELMKPDLSSRSADENGRRLVLLDPDNRDWGWRVVNHARYREKARKATFDAARVEDGRNADRMKTRRDPTRPDATRAHPPSDSNADSNALRVRESAREVALKAESFARLKAAYPEGTYRQSEWLLAERDVERWLTQGHALPELQGGVERYAKQCQAKGNLGTQFVLSPAKFFAAGPQPKFLEPYPLPAPRAGPASTKPAYTPSPTTEELEALERARAS